MARIKASFRIEATDKPASIAARARGRLDALIDFAAAVGAPLVAIGSLRGQLGPVGPGSQQRLEEVLHRTAEKAVSVGLRLALEPLNRYEADFIRTAEEARAFVGAVGHPALGLLLDTFTPTSRKPPGRHPSAS